MSCKRAIPPASESGLLLGATGSQLLLDGVPLEGAPAERQFALLLSTAGIASVQFFPTVTQEELRRFARAFPTSKAKPAELALQLKSALVGARGVRINEICFIATDARLKDASVAAQLAVASLGDASQDQFKQWLNDPKKLLELIAAAQGSHVDGGSGSGSAGAVGPGHWLRYSRHNGNGPRSSGHRKSGSRICNRFGQRTFLFIPGWRRGRLLDPGWRSRARRPGPKLFGWKNCRAQ